MQKNFRPDRLLAWVLVMVLLMGSAVAENGDWALGDLSGGEFSVCSC